jgi:hypothetical protein
MVNRVSADGIAGAGWWLCVVVGFEKGFVVENEILNSVFCCDCGEEVVGGDLVSVWMGVDDEFVEG